MDQISRVTFPRRHGCRTRAGMSLVEMLLVLVIISLLVALGSVSISSALRGSTLTRAGELIEAELAEGRQEAVASNHDVQVMFFNLTGNANGWRGIQMWKVDQTVSGAVTTPLTKVYLIPDGVIISSDATLSPLLNLLINQNVGTNPMAITGTTVLPVYGSVQYVGFRFRANGATDTIIDTSHNYLTLVNANGYTTGSTPANYFTLQINPINGKVTSYRP